MYIERIFLSQMLGVKQSNIRNISQIKENINVQLWNSGEQITICSQQYAEYVEAFRKKNKTHLDTLQRQFKVPDAVQVKGNRGGAKRKVGVFLMISGAIMSIHGFTIQRFSVL